MTIEPMTPSLEIPAIEEVNPFANTKGLRPHKCRYYNTTIDALRWNLLETEACQKMYRRRCGAGAGPYGGKLRNLLLAYGFMRGVSFERMVGNSRYRFSGDLSKVRALVMEHGPRVVSYVQGLPYSTTKGVMAAERERYELAWEEWEATAKAYERTTFEIRKEERRQRASKRRTRRQYRSTEEYAEESRQRRDTYNT